MPRQKLTQHFIAFYSAFLALAGTTFGQPSFFSPSRAAQACSIRDSRAIEQELSLRTSKDTESKSMVAGQTPLELPYVDIQGLDQQPQCDASCESAADIWSVLGVDTMADEMFDHGYVDGTFQDPGHQNMSNMQRFLQEKETYFAGRRVYEEKQPLFNGGNHSPIAVGYYGAPHPWPQSINTTHGLYPQETWNPEWASSDHESCSATTGNTWSPRPTESCPDYDPRYPSWSEPHVYPAECMYPGYGSGFAHGAVASSPHSITGTLSEIQQCPDTEADDGSAKGRIHSSNPGHLDTTTHLGPRTMNFHRDEGIGSSVNESTIASPISQTDNTAMESVSGDGEESDYSPQNRSKRAPKKMKGRTRSHPKGSTSPNAKRSSTTKGDPHQLTSPAKISKRTSSTAKSNNAVISPPSPHTLQAPNTNDSVCQDCCKPFPSASALQKHVLSAHKRPFHCSFRRYGCTSTFGSKNEWKRHVTSQHICQGIYAATLALASLVLRLHHPKATTTVFTPRSNNHHPQSGPTTSSTAKTSSRNISAACMVPAPPPPGQQKTILIMALKLSDADAGSHCAIPHRRVFAGIAQRIPVDLPKTGRQINQSSSPAKEAGTTEWSMWVDISRKRTLCPRLRIWNSGNG